MKWINLDTRQPLRFEADETHFKLDKRLVMVETLSEDSITYYDYAERDYKSLGREDFIRFEWLDESAPEGWVSVEERLPDYMECVLIAVKNSGVTEAQYTGSGADFQSGEYSFTATHWMPLPQPPKQ